MHKIFMFYIINVNDDIHQLYVPQKLGELGLLSVDFVSQERYQCSEWNLALSLGSKSIHVSLWRV